MGLSCIFDRRSAFCAIASNPANKSDVESRYMGDQLPNFVRGRFIIDNNTHGRELLP